MSAGTLALTNNSTTVTGTNTTFQTDLAANDFIVCKIGGTTYTLGVSAVGSNTALTLTQPFTGPTTSGVAWAAVANQALVGITTELAANLTSVYRSVLVNDANWTKVFSQSGNITVTLKDGSAYTGPSWNNIASTLSSKMDKTQNLNDVGNKATAWNNIAQYGTTSTTAAAGNDSRLGTVNAKSGGTITSSVGVTGSVIATTNIAAGATAGFAVAAGENNRVEINNTASGGNAGNPIGWTVYRWYNELVQAGIRRAGDTTIQSYFVAMSNVGSWEFLRSGNASAPGSWTNGSDERHKTKIKPVSDALASVLSWRGATYDKKDGSSEVGLIAQDVEKSCPVAITTNGERKFMDGTVIPDFKYLNTAGAAAAYHTEAIKAIFGLVEILALDNPVVLEMIDKIKASAEEIGNRTVENLPARKEEPPVLEVPSNEEIITGESDS